MKINLKGLKSSSASVLLMTVGSVGLLMITILAVLQFSMTRQRTSYQRALWCEAYYHAENVLAWAAQSIADAADPSTVAASLTLSSVGNSRITLPYLNALAATPQSLLQDAWLTLRNDPSGVANQYQVFSSAKVGNKTRTLRATVRRNPPSVIFDYEYFLNNWGWWWGSTITGNGDNRANWDFDFRGGPLVNGSVLANGRISENGTPVDPLNGPFPFRGWVQNDPLSYVHAGVPRVTMPNLKDFTYYKQKATNDQGRLYIGTNLVVDAVHNNTNKPGLYLDGTTNNQPIVIHGPVVIDGDVVIKGQLSGIGTLYVGGNLYVAGNLTYTNGPNFSVSPATLPTTDRDNWVRDNTNKTLVAFAVRETILGGDVNSSDWKGNCYDPAGYGLHNVGDERHLGADGIAGTPDDGVVYLDTNNDGVPDSAWFDADGDGVIDLAYDYNAQLVMTPQRAARVQGYPVDSGSVLKDYHDVASNLMNRIDAVFYCNHAVAMRLGQNDTTWNGTVISRDEAIVFNSTLMFRYDPRIHSRYSNDPNRYIDLGLPIANRVAIQTQTEVAPEEGFHQF
jgi:hypothetical protein